MNCGSESNLNQLVRAKTWERTDLCVTVNAEIKEDLELETKRSTKLEKKCEKVIIAARKTKKDLACELEAEQLKNRKLERQLWLMKRNLNKYNLQ